uniref:Uncharacterized protein n=1 Tax=Arundo donax TaxID=35708 RepID=A0A0A9ANC9_ARUDO
MLPRRSSA